ncbi:hypothetical protein F5887DRAFT_959632 [Amanita rubescens]|nr:hypothetical protein F5887DRAFT_959632 [Amanita rubescens]
MKFKSKRRDVSFQRDQLFTDLPYEMQEYIVLEAIDDPSTTFDELKALRLVCKLFNQIIAPRVLFCLAMFNYRYTILDNIRQFRALSSSRQRGDLHTARKLTIHGWEWNYRGPFVSYRSLPHIGLLIWANIMVSGYHCFNFLSKPKILPMSIYNGTLQIYGRFCLSRTPRLNLPNIRSVVWKTRKGDPKWVLSHTVKLFLQFAELEELSLDIDQEHYEYNYLIGCVCKLHKLRKLKITLRYTLTRFEMPRENQIDKLGKIIAANPDLTHLDLAYFSSAESYSLTDLFRHVPSDRPLKLEHLGISDVFEPSFAFMPHIRSLTSCKFSNSQLLEPLLAQEVFPPIMDLGSFDDLTVAYLTRHPGLTSLTLRNIDSGDTGNMLRILIRHSKTLTCLKMFGSVLVRALQDEQNAALLHQYYNLRRLVLFYHLSSNISYFFPPLLEDTLFFASRLGKSLTLVFTDHAIFRECRERCVRSRSDPSLRDLARRIAYERPDYYVETLFGNH